MRLLNARTGEFCWGHDPAKIKYATFSHVSSNLGEESYQDLLDIQAAVRKERQASGSNTRDVPVDAVLQRASPKVREACKRAQADDIEFVWIDFCCIDKTSSAELSDAINSGIAWSAHATMCYVFLDDVDASENARDPQSRFRSSGWHNRMWTLVELIAPKNLTFLDAEWRPIGTKEELADVLEEITGVDSAVLTHRISLSSVSVARRMSWASKRVTTHKEDEAYALMGLFGVNMPVMYGEGEGAFVRLQEEILKAIPDQSIFVWDARQCALEAAALEEVKRMLLAPCPAAFAHSAGVKAVNVPLHPNAVPDLRPTYQSTPHGMHALFHLVSVGPFVRLAPLACEDENGRRLALVLSRVSDGEIYVVGAMGWERIAARFRSMLSRVPWDTTSSETGGTGRGDEYTRIVRLIPPYPRTGPLTGIYVNRRSTVVSSIPTVVSSRDSETDALLRLGAYAHSHNRSWNSQGWIRTCVSTVTDILFVICALCLMLFLVGLVVPMSRAADTILLVCWYFPGGAWSV